MRLKSTGLGATELFGDLTSMEKSMSGVLMKVKIKKPVVWRVRVFLNPQDLRAIVRRALMPRNVWFVIKTLIGGLSLFKRKTSSLIQVP
jgi:hypothetical protein